MERVHRSVNGGVGLLRGGNQLVYRLEDRFIREAESIGRQLPAHRVGLDHADDLQLVGVAFGVRGVYQTAVSRSDNNGTNSRVAGTTGLEEGSIDGMNFQLPF
ncbi:hypothetical protein GCM10020370_16160 [Paenibacillus hodogayensis]